MLKFHFKQDNVAPNPHTILPYLNKTYNFLSDIFLQVLSDLKSNNLHNNSKTSNLQKFRIKDIL